MRKTTREPAPAIQAQESPPQNATASSQKHARKTRRRIERDRGAEEEKHSRNGTANPHILSASQLVCDMAAPPAARRPGAAT